MCRQIAVVVMMLCLAITELFAGDKAPPPADSLTTTLQIADPYQRQKKVYDLIVRRFLYTNANDGQVTPDLRLMARYDKANFPLYQELVKVVFYKRLYQFDRSDQAITRGIRLAQKRHNDLMLYLFHTQRAYLYTERNPSEAVNNYRIAHSLAFKLKDEQYQVRSFLGLSDLYYKIGFYDRSLQYLDQIAEYCARNPAETQQLCATVVYNKAENFFGLQQADSLKVYRAWLNKFPDHFVDIKYLRLRLAYYQNILAHHYAEAIPVIRTVLQDTTRYDMQVDLWHLANAYYHTGQPDSAQRILNDLISGNINNRTPFRDQRHYEMLARIAGQKGDHQSAYRYAAEAHEQAVKQMHDLKMIAGTSSDIRSDQLEDRYQTQTLEYQQEKTMLILLIVLAVLVTIIVAMFYYNAKQQRRYESLLYTNKREELAFINSHEVRKHLSNILGLCQMMQDTDIAPDEMTKYNDYLQRSAADLDEAIKSVEQKLSERH